MSKFKRKFFIGFILIVTLSLAIIGVCWILFLQDSNNTQTTKTTMTLAKNKNNKNLLFNIFANKKKANLQLQNNKFHSNWKNFFDQKSFTLNKDRTQLSFHSNLLYSFLKKSFYELKKRDFTPTYQELFNLINKITQKKRYDLNIKTPSKEDLNIEFLLENFSATSDQKSVNFNELFDYMRKLTR